MGGTYFDDEQEIGPHGLILLRKVLADLVRDQADVPGVDEELGLAKELVALFKSGFRSEEELKAMVQRSSILNHSAGYGNLTFALR
ncbi:MAG: hypothetical protein QE284_10200 [Rhizobium sp.]|nr:hypothetical protein [Rhizobium sp.]